jgi:hypothetical protein
MLYFSLQYVYEDTKDENLGEFCSDMNPFIWEGEKSGDPSYYEKFKKIYTEKYKENCTLEQAYNICLNYLNEENKDNTYAKAAIDAFKLITLNDWIEACNNKED